jgi:hypothetical protein
MKRSMLYPNKHYFKRKAKGMVPINNVLQLYLAANNQAQTYASTSAGVWSTTTPIPAFVTASITSGTGNALAQVWWDQTVPDDYPGRPCGYPPIAVFDDPYSPPVYKVQDQRPTKLSLPDGTVIDVKSDGSYVINDADAKVVYRASRVHDFNAYLNASDKLEDFIRYCGEQGVRQDEMLSIPVRHFVAWLVVEAALADGEEPPAALPDLRDFCQQPQLLLEAAE